MTKQTKKEEVRRPSITQRLMSFHKNAPTITKEEDNPYYKSKYCTYETIMKKCLPVLMEHGLIIYHCTFIENEKEYIKTVVSSVEDEKIETISPVTPQKADIQSKGAYFTYMKRYHVMMLLALPIYDPQDNDGEDLMSGCIKDHQARQLTILLKNQDSLLKKVLQTYDIIDLRYLPRDKFGECKSRIEKTLIKNASNPEQEASNESD